MICNELLINCFKSPVSNGSKIEIKFTENSPGYTLIISDNRTEIFADEEAESFSFKLVKSLVKQLNGTYIIETENNPGWEISFK